MKLHSLLQRSGVFFFVAMSKILETSLPGQYVCQSRFCEVVKPKVTQLFIYLRDLKGHQSEIPNFHMARRAGSDGSMSASGSAGPGFDPRRGSKFSFENLPRG